MIPLLLGFVLGAAAIVFALQNTSPVSLGFLGWEFESSLAILIILATMVGALLGILFSFPSIFRKSREVSALRKQVRTQAEEADALRKWNQDTVAHFETLGVTQGIDRRPGL